MTKRMRNGPSKDKFITESLALIAKKGGSKDVNLREISRRIGCAHTNVYNYFESLEDLMWAGFDRTLDLYSTALTSGLEKPMSPHKYFRTLLKNMVNFAVENPGLFRFLSSDPINPENIPQDTIDKVVELKAYFMEVVFVLGEGEMTRKKAGEVGNILLAYLDGETFNFINGRILPDEDILGRVQKNAERLFMLLTSKSSDGIKLSRKYSASSGPVFPSIGRPR